MLETTTGKKRLPLFWLFLILCFFFFLETLEGDLELHFGYTYESNIVADEAKGEEHQTSVSFELGDEQEDDEFIVELAVDETYGTCECDMVFLPLS